MAADEARTPPPQEPVCDICRNPIRPDQDRVTVQEQHYHARCYERNQSRVAASKARGGKLVKGGFGGGPPKDSRSTDTFQRG
jgi:hypothetical protein